MSRHHLAARSLTVLALLALSACSKHEPDASVDGDLVAQGHDAPVARDAQTASSGRVMEEAEDAFDTTADASFGVELKPLEGSGEPMGPHAEQMAAMADDDRRQHEKKETTPATTRTAPLGLSGIADSKMAADGGGSAGGAYIPAPVDADVYASPPPPPPAPDPISNSETYTDYGVNGFVLAARDRLSTFAVDVDTASYAVTRAKLNSGYLPPEAAVRVEEFVNNFDYEYKQPPATDPFAVDFEASPSPWNPRNHIVRIGVQGRDVSLDQRKSVHLTFLVDTSGSMQAANKIGLVKKTLTMLTKELRDGDTVAIATYAGNTRVVLEPTSIGQSDRILRALDGLSAGGSTAMGAGIDLAYKLADKSFVDGAVNRVIICSDGDANVGQTSHSVLTQQIKGYAAKGITLTTVGYGTGNYKDTMMERLANEGDGNYYYIDTEREARRIFVDKLSSAMEVIAKDVKIQVDWNPEDVVAYRLIGYENRDIADKDFRNDAVDAGEIGSGHQVTALYEVALADDAAGAIATVRIRNKAPGPESPAVERSFNLQRSSFRGSVDETSRQFRIALASATFAEILRGSPHVGEVSLRQVQAMAEGARRAEYPADNELVGLIGTAARLKGEGLYSQR